MSPPLSIKDMSMQDVTEQMQYYAALTAWGLSTLGKVRARVIWLRGSFEDKVAGKRAAMRAEEGYKRVNKDELSAQVLERDEELRELAEELRFYQATEARLEKLVEAHQVIRDTLSRHIEVFKIERERRP